MKNGVTGLPAPQNSDLAAADALKVQAVLSEQR
jgi:hypothetical protein